MSAIDALKLSFQAPVRQSAKTTKPHQDVQEPKEKSAFFKFLSNNSPDRQEVKGEQQQKEIKNKLEDTLKAINELPKETLSPEEISILSAMVQMLAQQTSEMIDHQQGDQQLIAVVQQLEQALNDLSALSSINFEGGVPAMGVEEKNILPTDQVHQSLPALFQPLDIEKQTAKDQAVSLQQVKSFDNLFQQLTILIEQLAQVTDEGQMNGQALKIEPAFPLAGSQAQANQGNGEIELGGQVPPNSENSMPKGDQVQNQNQSQLVTGMALQDVPESQGPSKMDASPQTPVVRFSHLAQDLGEIFKGNLRLGPSLEGTQLRVNIYPEHLGHLEIRLTSAEGKITAQIFTASLTAKEALDLQVHQLRNSLMQQGLSVEKIEITQQPSQHSFGQQHAQPEQRFAQQPERQAGLPRNGKAYHLMEEEAAVERHQHLDGSVKVNYTI